MWRIGIVDDDRQVLQGIQNAIPWGELGAEWGGSALNGREGLTMVRDAQPHILITDIYMPVMNGLEMVEELRGEKYNGKVVILSGYTDFEYARQAIHLNISDYLLKPISVPTLVEVLRKVIARLAEEGNERARLDKMQQRLRLYAPYVEQEWIQSFVSGRLADSLLQNEQLPEQYRFWQSTVHVVMGLTIVRDVRVDSFSLKDLKLIGYALKNLVCEVAQETFAHYDYSELYGTYSALLIHTESDGSADRIGRDLRQLAERLIAAAEQYLRVKLRIGLGGTKTDWREIPASAEEAFRTTERDKGALWTRSFQPEAGVGVGSMPEGPMRSIPITFYQELAGAMKARRGAEAARLIDDYLKEFSKWGTTTNEYLRTVLGEMWAILAYSMYEVGIVLDEIFPYDNVYAEWSDLVGIDQSRAWFADKMERICGSDHWIVNGKHRETVEAIIRYIDEHYAEDITTADLAEQVYLSKNYLAHLFKEMMGESVNTYLTRVRMNKARELLMERKMLVYEVASKVGYQNVPYFSTLFKKYMGITPTEII
ncbi:response regulator [Cohnella fermenti]|uniref:Response regulator n=1 Tax=Cohnella fermenti TaxID=2565925 RepID=A0A4V3WE03_9BACL|nr:response regulator [Cohnella fermenti]THF74325.1 response regulator [Cohnella fermenti]